MITTDLTSYYHYYPCNVTLVGARREGKINFMAVAWNMCLSFSPPLFGVSIAPQRFTHDMILEAGQFTANFLALEEIATVHGTGRVSGRDYDKVALFSIPLEDARVIDCPTIKSAYAAYECRLIDHHPAGDHNLFVGEVVAIHYDPEAFTGQGLLNPEKVSPTMYLGSNTYLTAAAEALKRMPAEITIPLQAD